MKRALANMGLDSGRSQMIRDPLAPRRIIYGEALVGGIVTFYYQKPGADGYSYMVVTLASHPVEAITQIRFNNLPFQNSDGTEVNTSVVKIRKFLGKPEGERDLDWENEIPNYWGPLHLGKGVARLHLRLKWNENAWPNGLPEVSAVVRGAKVYDPRDQSQSPTNPASWKWNNNCALVAAHFLHLRKAVAYSRIDKAALITAANVCSEQVELAYGDEEPRYRANGLYTYDQNPLDALAELQDTMAGQIIDAGGRWTIKAGAWSAPVLELSDADIVSEFRCTPLASRQDTYNGVRGTFFNPANEWAATDFPAVKNDTYRDWDGGQRLWKDAAYPYITSSAQAQRVAKIDLERARQALVIEADFNARALRTQPGDIIQLTRPRLGWVKKLFEIRRWELKVEPSEGAAAGGSSGMALRIGITAVETAPQVYDWNSGDETTIDPAPNTGLIPQNYVAPPANFKLAQPSDAETTALPRIKASWAKSQDPLVVSGGKTELGFRQDSESTWAQWSRINGSHTHDYINDLTPYKKVHIRARHENINGVKSDWATASITPEATDPYLDLSHWAIGRRRQGGFYSSHLIIKSKTKSGAPYAGRYRVRLQVNATVFHSHYLSTVDESEKSFQLHNTWGSVLHVEVTLYKGGSYPVVGITPEIEKKFVPVIKDGQDGLPGAPGAPGGGGSGQQYSLMMFRSLWIIANGQNTIATIPGGGSKPAGQNAPLTAPSSVFQAGITYNFYKWAASAPAGSWIANPNSPSTTIAMHGNATVYANYHSYQSLPNG